MVHVLEMPCCRFFYRGVKIRPLFENTGIPGYFTIATEIPPQLMDAEPPKKDFYLVLRDKYAPRIDLQRRHLALPTIQQVLWAVGFMGVPLTNVIGKKPIRFLHQPFRAHMCTWKGSVAWRQIFVSQTETGYSVGTVSVTDRSPDAFLGYMMPQN